MSPSAFPSGYLIPTGNIILLGASGIGIVRAIRTHSGLEKALVGCAIGLLGITFCLPALEGLDKLSLVLQSDIERLGNPKAFRDLVFQSIEAGDFEPSLSGTSSPTITSLTEQLFRSGVFGVASAIGDFIFILSQFFIEVGRDILLALLRFIFPVIWGLYPLFPNLGHSMVSYAIEMSLWGPTLYLIQVLVGHIAPQYLNRSGSLGVPIVAIEIVAALLMLMIPGTVHRLIRGTLHTGGESTALGFIKSISKTVSPRGRKS